MRTIVIGTQGHNSGFISYLLVPKLQLGNAFFEAPASQGTAKQELARLRVPKQELGNQPKKHYALLLRCVVAPLRESKKYSH